VLQVCQQSGQAAVGVKHLILAASKGVDGMQTLQSQHILHRSSVDAADNMDLFECGLAAPNSTEYEQHRHVFPCLFVQLLSCGSSTDVNFSALVICQFLGAVVWFPNTSVPEAGRRTACRCSQGFKDLHSVSAHSPESRLG